jgi:hypothetical protein
VRGRDRLHGVSLFGLSEAFGFHGARRPGRLMTDERDKRSRSDSRARPTTRDVPFARGVSESEPAPRGQRPNQLPRDPTYEAELAKVELAVLRDRDRRSDPSTKQGGRALRQAVGEPPESVTPESPGTRGLRGVSSAPQSVESPSSSGRAVASGTLLSVGAVDPRGRTEPTLETPRMFFSQAEGREAYFKPGKIPAVTVHQTLETETVKLSDSVDPRRAKTLPRIDRAALARFSQSDGALDSEAPMATSSPSASAFDEASSAPPAWRSVEYEAASSLGEGDGQIHASLSPFRDQAEPSFSLNGVPTRAEPLAARREVESVASLPAPDTSAMPTQRDLPAHRIEASRPPPPPRSVPEPSSPQHPAESAGLTSEAPSPTTASIAAPEPARRSTWTNYAAFLLALLLAVALGMWLTRGLESTQSSPDATRPVPRTDVKLSDPLLAAPAPVAKPGVLLPQATSPRPTSAPRPELEASKATPAAPRSAQIVPAPAAPPATNISPPKSPPSKPPRETIF